MLRSLFTGVSGLKQHQTRMDVLSNNIANVNTTGFKRGRALFQDLFSETLRNAQQAFGDYGGLNPMQVGLGTKLGSIDTLMEQGTLETTGKSTDLAIEGEGFFSVQTPAAATMYTRDGNLNINPNYDLVSTNTGFKVMGWMATQNPTTGNLEVNQTGNIPETINTVRYLKKHAHQTNNVTFASNLDSGADERAVKMATDYLSFKDTAGNAQKLQLSFKKIDSKNWLWSAFDDDQGNVANGAFKTDEDGKLVETSVVPPGPTSTALAPNFVYDPDGTSISASSSAPMPDSQNSGNGSASAIMANGPLVKDELVKVVFDGGDPNRATTFRVVGDQRGFIGGGTLGGTQPKFAGVPWKFESGWQPSNNVSFQISEVQNLNTQPLLTRENRATTTFTAGNTYSTSDIKSIINTALKNNGINAQAQYDSVLKQWSILSNNVGSGNTLMMDNISGPMAELGFEVGNSGGTEYFSNYGVSYAVEPFNIAEPVIFQVSDSTGHSATVKFSPGTYTRNQMQSTIQNSLVTANVTAQAAFVDSDGDTVPDRLKITANGGTSLQITDVQNLQSQMGLNPLTLGSNTSKSTIDFGSFVGGLTSSRSFSPEPINIANEVRFTVEDQYLNGNEDDPATPGLENEIVIPTGNSYTRNDIRDIIQNRLTAMNITAQAVFVDTDADGIPNQLQINGLTGEQIRVSDTSGVNTLTSELGITPSNQWTPARDIAFSIYRPDWNTSITVNVPTAGGPFNAESLRATIQNAIDAPEPGGFGPGVAAVELLDKNGDGVQDQLQIRAINPAERLRFENVQNISLLGFTSGVSVSGSGGSAPQIFNGLDLSSDAWNPTLNVSFIISDAEGHSTEVAFPDLDSSNNQITYTRSAILSTINAQLVKDNVGVSAAYSDTNNDGIFDRLVLTGKQTGAGQRVTISGDSSMGQLGLQQGSYYGTAPIGTFDQGGLKFTLTEGTDAWKPNEFLSFNTTAERGSSSSVKIELPKPDAEELVFQTTVDNETFKTTGAVNKGAIHTTSISVFDSLGANHEMVTEWEHTDKATQEWRYKISYGPNDPEIKAWLRDPANGITDPALPSDRDLERANDKLLTSRKGFLYFQNNGKIDLARSSIRDVEATPAGSNPIKIKLDMALATQFDSPFTTKAREQDGYEMGLLETIYFEQDGTIRGVYSNGQKQPIGQLALTTFNNPAGLEKKGKNLYEFSPNSGQPLIGKPGVGAYGLIVPGSLEMSNVDIAEEFTNMIITQRAFQANSRVITTSDEILQEVVNLKR